eukprot:GDKJ01020081.1.p1 GENE.GDKJ01020081.1~~GDKJ01020081.1.p1  ORF type:complete len:264 (-),score=44.64 GDKJ01020081.1:281-1072(-)
MGDAQLNLLFIGVGRVTDGVILATYADYLEPEQKQQTEHVFARLLEAARLKLSPTERQRLQWNDGSVCCYLDGEGQCLYGLVTSTMQYPENYAFRLLNQLSSDVSQRFGPLLGDMLAYSLNKPLRPRLSELMDTFENTHILEQQSRSMTQASTNNNSSRQANDIKIEEGDSNRETLIPKKKGCCTRRMMIASLIFLGLAALGGAATYYFLTNKKSDKDNVTPPDDSNKTLMINFGLDFESHTNSDFIVQPPHIDIDGVPLLMY